MTDSDEGFTDYVEDTVDPGIWLLLATCIFCFGLMLLVVPMLVYFHNRKRQHAKKLGIVDQTVPMIDGRERTKVDASMVNILRPDKETRKILKLAIPYTVSALASSVLSNISLIYISRYIGTRSMAAYALVSILVGLTDGIAHGPIYACTALCAQAVGAGNNKMAGNYIQLSVITYLAFSAPLVYFWSFYMYDVISYLEWGDAETAQIAQDYTRTYMGSVIVGGISSAVWELLEVTDHAVAGTVASILWGIVNAFCVAMFVTRYESATLEHVGLIFSASAVVFVGLTFIYASLRGWLRPFNQGLFGSLSFRSPKAVRNMMKQAFPLAFGSLLDNAEWTVLTFFASHLGSAEVATWAILGSIWDVFYSTTSGIGDAAEIRVAYHLGDGHPTMARLSTYKTLFLGTIVSCIVSVVYFSLQNRLAELFTHDPVLQSMLDELIPFVGVANVCMSFGMTCYSAIGAQGKYRLATWVSFISSWGLSIPLAAVYVYVFNIDLQGLTSAVVMGYVTSGACLSCFLLSTDWYKVAKKIRADNEDMMAGDDKPEDAEAEEFYATLHHGKASQAVARRNIRLVTLPAGTRSGLLIGNIYGRRGTYVLLVRNWSPLAGNVKAGDSILAMDDTNLRDDGAQKVAGLMVRRRNFDRDLSIVAPPADMEELGEEDDDNIMIEEIAEDDHDNSAPSGDKSGLFQKAGSYRELEHLVQLAPGTSTKSSEMTNKADYSTSGGTSYVAMSSLDPSVMTAGTVAGRSVATVSAASQGYGYGGSRTTGDSEYAATDIHEDEVVRASREPYGTEQAPPVIDLTAVQAMPPPVAPVEKLSGTVADSGHSIATASAATQGYGGSRTTGDSECATTDIHADEVDRVTRERGRFAGPYGTEQAPPLVDRTIQVMSPPVAPPAEELSGTVADSGHSIATTSAARQGYGGSRTTGDSECATTDIHADEVDRVSREREQVAGTYGTEHTPPVIDLTAVQVMSPPVAPAEEPLPPPPQP